MKVALNSIHGFQLMFGIIGYKTSLWDAFGWMISFAPSRFLATMWLKHSSSSQFKLLNSRGCPGFINAIMFSLCHCKMIIAMFMDPNKNIHTHK